ncbi:MAG: hypothetical protein QNJ72_43990 [Pleurocapsa sp. MO_226.B13]|nr:hypothetical protein [Pleurocapsa sp. MO_226.B13]
MNFHSRDFFSCLTFIISDRTKWQIKLDIQDNRFRLGDENRVSQEVQCLEDEQLTCPGTQ